MVAVDAYLVVKTIHILSSTVLFGTGIGIAFFMLVGQRSKDRRVQLAVARWTVMADGMFIAPAAVIQLVTGVHLVHQGGHSFTDLWIAAALFLYIAVAICWLIVVRLQLHMRAILGTASRSSPGDQPLPKAYHRSFRLWFFLGWPAFIGLLIVFWLMVAKPML